MEPMLKINGMEMVDRTLLRTVPAEITKTMERAHDRIQRIVVARARKYCPISPKKGQYEGTMKRKKQSISTSFAPGGLTRSIDGESTKNYASIFVPMNSEGARYAKKIHDGTYNLGVGSRAKAAMSGMPVGPRYIERAIKDETGNIKIIHQDEINQGVRRM